MLDSGIQDLEKVNATLMNSVFYSDKVVLNSVDDFIAEGIWCQTSVEWPSFHAKTQSPIPNGWENILINSLRKVDATTHLELLDIEEERIKNFIWSIRFASTISYREALANRIYLLFKDAKEEDELSIGIELTSLRNFYFFICDNPALKQPKISLTPNNNIYASWKTGNDKVFSVHFFPNGDARFVVFAPNDRHPDRPVRISGTATIDVLMKIVEPLGVKTWAMQ